MKNINIQAIKVLFVALFITFNTISAHSNTISKEMMNTLHKHSLVFLAKYNLHPVNKTPFYEEPKSDLSFRIERTVVFDTTESHTRKTNVHRKLFFKQLRDVSEKIGINTNLYIGKRLIRLNYLLSDSSQANRKITAHFLFSDTNIAGAYMVLDGYYGGFSSLNDHSHFKPKNFKFPIFNPELIDTISIVGSWDKSDKNCNWLNKVDIFSKNELLYITKIFSSSKEVIGKLDYWIKDPIEEYTVVINLKTGERFYPHFIFRNDTVYLNDYKCYYILDRKFMNFVKESIESRGISTCNGRTVQKNRNESVQPELQKERALGNTN